VLFALLAGSVQGTWEYSEHANSSINFSYSGFNDALLDYTTPVNFQTVYLNASNAPIDNASGACFLNFSTPAPQTVALNYSGGGLYQVNLTASNETLINKFQVYCHDSNNRSHDHVFSNEEGAVTFQYDLYEPIIIDVYTANEAGSLAGTNPSFLAGQETTLYLLARNITGNQSPSNITSATCNISWVDGNKIATAQGFKDYYTARFILPSAGVFAVTGSCFHEGINYSSSNSNLTVSPLFIPSGFNLGEVDIDPQALVLAANDTNSFLISSPYEGGAAPNIQITQLFLHTSVLLNQSYAPYSGSYGWVDLFNAAAQNLIYAGSASSLFNLFSSTSSAFDDEQEIPSLQNFIQPSLVSFDFTGNGLLNLLLSGQVSGAGETTLFLENNGTNLTEKATTLPNLQDASICYGNFHSDNLYDLFVSGYNGSEIRTDIFQNNENDFSLRQTLPTKLYKSTCAIGRFLDENTTSLIHFGANNSSDSNNPNNWEYAVYNDTKNWSKTSSDLLPGFNGSIYGDMVVADFNGDGLSDIFLCGGTGGHESLTLFVNDINKSGSFVSVQPFNANYALPHCSMGAADYDFDGDLDLAYTGVGNGESILLFNNSASSVSTNNPPTPPANLFGVWNESTGSLWINWSTGTDDMTPQGMLSYNLEIESPTKGLLLSGQPAVTSKPAQGYLGNMQYRRSTTLFNQTPENIVVRIQTIDAGLQRSNWKEIDVFWDECTPAKNWEISTVSGCSLPDAIQSNSIITVSNGSTLTADTTTQLGTNTTIRVINGTLNLSRSTLAGNGSAIEVGENGTLIAITTSLNGINFSTNSPVTLTDCRVDHFQGNASATFLNTSWNSLNTTETVDVRFYYASEFKDQFNASVENVAILNSSGPLTSGTRLNLSGYVLNETGSTFFIHNLTFQKSGYYTRTFQVSLSENLAPVITLNKEPTPQTDGFNVTEIPVGLGQNYSADLAALSNVSNISVKKTGQGAVAFLEPVNLSYVNLSQALSIQQSSIRLNSSLAPGLNRSAELSFINLTFQTEPVVLHDEILCDSCSGHSFDGSTFNVTVSGFSTYSLENNSQISLISPSVLFNATLSNFSVIYHAYGNSSDWISSASCELIVNSNVTDLDGDQGTHSTSLSFNKTGEVNASVFCSGNNSYEPINQTFTLNIVRNGPYFLKDSDYIGLVYNSAFFGTFSGANKFWATGHTNLQKSSRASISEPAGFSLNVDYGDSHSVLADLNNDGGNDLIVMGTTSRGAAFEWYNNLTTLNSFGINLALGDFEVLDFDYDGDLDILACGENLSGQAQTVLLKNQLAEKNYRENVTFLERVHSLPNLKKCSLEITRDTAGVWVMLTGRNASDDNIVSAYKLYDGSFQKAQDFTPNSWDIPELSSVFQDFTEDQVADLILIGNCEGKPTTKFFTGDGSNFSQSTKLSDQLQNFSKFGTRITVGRLTNKTNQSLVISGISDSGLQVQAYGFNGTDFIEQDLALDVEPTYQGSLILGDVDADSDLDLWITGQSTDGSITHLYTNTLAEYAGADKPPSPPTSIEANYSNGILQLNWSGASDTETPNALLSYSLGIGTAQNSNSFLSGTRPSYASGLRTGNQGNTRSTNLSFPDACFFIQAQSIDASYQESNWSSLLVANNHTEICNGYDNDCDGSTDEDFTYLGSNLFIYNGSINGTLFTCSFYELHASEKLSCPNDPAKSQGDACKTSTYTGAAYAWNTTTKTCDCNLSSASLKNVRVSSDRSSGGEGFYAPVSPDPVAQEKPVDESSVDSPTPEPSKTTSSSQTPQTHFTTSLSGFEVRTEVNYHDGWTVMTNHLRNTDRTKKEKIQVTVEFDTSLTDALKSLRSVNDYQFTDEHILKAMLKELDYLEEAVLLYSIPGHYDLEYFKNSPITIEAHQTISKEILAEIETKQRISAEESITTNVSETVENNKTVILLDIDLKDNVSQVHGIEIEQEIPKCLIEEITDSILESAIDPALLKHVEIKEADPLLVWRFDRLEDAVNLELTLDALRSADCEDKVTLKLLAKSFIYQNQPINKLSILLVLLASFGLVGLTFSPVLLASKNRFQKHENPHVIRLAKVILHQRHKGESDKIITKNLLHNDEAKADINSSFEHLKHHQPSRHGLLLYEHRVEIVLFMAVLVLSIMELGGWLPGYLDWFKKVLSWAIMLMVVYHTNLARLFFNEEAPRFSVTLMTGMFLMHLVRLAEFASNGLSKSVGFVFDWYVLIVRLDAQIYLSWIFFTAGLLILTACAIYAAKSLPVRERSLCCVFFKTPQSKNRFTLIGRNIGLLAIFCIFFFSVFNRLIEWLAIAVDSALFVLTAIILIALSLSMIAHHKGHRSHHFEKLGEILADGYLIWLGVALGIFGLLRPFFPAQFATFAIGGMGLVVLLTLVFVALRLKKLHEMSELEKIPLALDHLYEKFIRLFRYPRTLALALAGLLVLQLVVESALYIIPNITGKVSHLYGGHAENTLLSLFGNTGMISQQLFLMSAPEAIAHAFLYLASFLGLVSFLLIPVWVWALAFRNRGHGMASGSIFTWMQGHSNWTKRLGRALVIAGLPLGIFYLYYPVLTIEGLFSEGSAGVRFVPHLLQVSVPGGTVALLTCLISVLFITGLMLTPKIRSWVPYLSIGSSFIVLVKIYFMPFVCSLVTETLSLFGSSGSEPVALRLYPYLLGTLQVVDILLIYLLGGICMAFLALPLWAKQAMVSHLKAHHPFDRLFELAENEHLLEYYDEAQSRFAGNLIHHLEHYIKRCTDHGTSHKEQVRVMYAHGYPGALIRKAMRRVSKEKLPSRKTREPWAK